MKKNVLITMLLITGWAGRAEATNLAVITSPPTILNLLVFLFALVSAVICYQVLSVVKGGELSRSWQLFVLAFSLLALSQAALLVSQFEIMVLPTWMAPALAVLWAGVFVYGVFDTKRALS